MSILKRIAYCWRSRRMAQDLAEEMEFHRAMLQNDLEDSGLTRDQAAAAGRRAMGAATQMAEASRAVWVWPWLESVVQDVSYAARSLRRQPAFALFAVIVLACAIGLNTSLFTVYNAVALRPWPVADAGRVVRMFAFVRNPPKGLDHYGGFSAVEYRFLAEHSHSMAGLFLSRGEGGMMLEQRKARYVYVSANYFSTLGVAMARGRGFLPEEDRVEAPAAVAVLSYLAWQNRYGGDPNILGRRIHMQDMDFTVVGVGSADFAGTNPEPTDLWLPISSMALLYPGDSWARHFIRERGNCCGEIGGRLAPGVSREQAKAELSALRSQFAAQFDEKSDGVVLAGTPLLTSPATKSEFRVVFGLMFAGVTLVLLLACANVGNLLLARGAARRREIGVRLSLGAGRARVIRQLLTESLVLAFAGAVSGIWIAWILPGPLLRKSVGEVAFTLQPDLTVLGYTLVLAMLACIACGLAPALAATRGSFHDALKQRRTGGISLRSSLLAVQVSVSVVLLVGAGLMVRGIQHARAADPGFSTQDTASLNIQLPASAYPPPAVGSFFQTLSRSIEERLNGQPFGWSDVEPLANAKGFTSFRLPGEDRRQERLVLQTSVSAGYLDVLRIPIVSGRNFQPSDSGNPVVLVNQAMADQCFPHERAVGKTIITDSAVQIVGVVRNAHTAGLDAVEPTVYTNVWFPNAPRLIVRSSSANFAAITALVKTMEPRALVEVTPLARNFDRWLSSARIGAAIAGILGILALSLAAIGMAGVFAYSVEQRKKEIGVRMALGARPAQVIRAVFRSAMRSLAVGLLLGIAGAVAASGLLGRYLFGISRLDAATYAAVLLTLAVAGLVATYLPARRATRVDPIAALRQD